MQSVGRFIQWHKANGPSPCKSKSYNILYHDPEHVAPKVHRFDICASITDNVAANEFGVGQGVIPARRCARLRHIRPDRLLGQSIHYLYAKWLPQSAQTLRDYPLFVHRVSCFPDVAETESVLDIYLPLADETKS